MQEMSEAGTSEIASLRRTYCFVLREFSLLQPYAPPLFGSMRQTRTFQPIGPIARPDGQLC